MSTVAQMIRRTALAARPRRAARAFGLAGVLAALGLPMMPVANAAAISRTIQPTPNPSGSKGSFLKGVSCPTATACTAVGYYQSSSGPALMLTERWNGTRWTIAKTPNPPGGVSSVLEGVSCTSATACMAVGYFHYPVGGTVPLADRWDGTKWTAAPAQIPAGAEFAFFNGVSCTSATNCTAVGTYFSAGSGGSIAHTLAEGWNGASWTIQSTTDPSGSSGAGLSGVSCPSLTTCVAVGDWSNGGNTYNLAERWTGSGWFFELPTDRSSSFNALSGVSCASATACMAVGYYSDPVTGFPKTVGELSSGTASWTQQPAPSPGQTHSYLFGVSCAAAQASCTAVGSFDSIIGIDETLGDFWGGSNWAFGSTPTVPLENTYLRGVSCTSATVCAAVGYYKNSSGTYVTFAERYS
jgi:hypothetical protein